MTVTAKDLRFNVNMLFDVLSKGEDITITYRGKPKAKLISTDKIVITTKKMIHFLDYGKIEMCP